MGDSGDGNWRVYWVCPKTVQDNRRGVDLRSVEVVGGSGRGCLRNEPRWRLTRPRSSSRTTVGQGDRGEVFEERAALAQCARDQVLAQQWVRGTVRGAHHSIDRHWVLVSFGTLHSCRLGGIP